MFSVIRAGSSVLFVLCYRYYERSVETRNQFYDIEIEIYVIMFLNVI